MGVSYHEWACGVGWRLVATCAPFYRRLCLDLQAQAKQVREADRVDGETKRMHSGEGDIGADGGAIEVALAFSQRREIFPRQGAPRFFSIFFDLVLDPHNYRRHFRLAGNLGSNSRSLLELGRDFFTVPVKNQNGGRDDRHLIGITFGAFSLGGRAD